MVVRKVILDVDPGIDDAVALCLALFDPRLEVVAVTAVAGNVSAEQATRNLQTIIEQLDPPRWPRIGAATEIEPAQPVDGRRIHGADGLGNANFEVAELRHQHAADKVISDEVRANPELLTLICLGPLTNIARALQRDPALTALIGQILITGGTVSGPGDITAAAEFNMYCDPLSAQAVFRSHTTKLLVPLDITQQVVLGYELLEQLPGEESRAGKFLRRIMPFYFRAFRQELGLEAIYLHDAVAVAAASHPELFELDDMAGDVETRGELTLGATVFDRRSLIESRRNMGVCTQVDAAAVKDYIVRGLTQAGQS